MAEKLIVLSDMWGVKKGLWITSYFGYLQQYYDISFYDCQQLASLDVPICTEENIHQAFVNGGIDTAIKQLLRKESDPCHYLAFSTGGTIAYKAALEGLPMKSLTAISPTRIRYEKRRPAYDLSLVFGELDKFRPDEKWAKSVGVDLQIMPNFGHQLYTDEKIIGQICLELLQRVTRNAS